MKAATPTVRRPTSVHAHEARAAAPLRAALAVLTACLLLCGPAAAASVQGARKRAAKPAAKPAAQKSAAADKSGDAPKEGETTTKAGGTQGKPASLVIEHEQSAYPSDGDLRKYKLVIKYKDGAKLFETDPKLISLSITPAGAADVAVRLVTPTRIEADFWAPESFKVGEVSVSVYDRANPQLVVASSDVEKAAEAAGIAAEAAGGKKAKAKAADTEQPEIASTTIIFLQRAYGIGRMKIEGKNFGNYAPPPVSAEDYLLCYEPLARQALVDALGEHPQAVTRQAIEDERCNALKQDAARFKRWQEWHENVEHSVKVALVPRNTDLRIEQAKVLYIDDKLIDVYFEFNRFYRNSEPLRLASTTVTVRKGDAPKPQDAKAPARTQTASGARPLGDAVVLNASGGAAEEVKPAPATASPFADERKTYIATKEVGTRQDENLEYRYTVLDSGSAARLFGKGVADNFYVIQLSVTNKGEKKIAVPLASIQAEIEWAYGPADEKTGDKGGCQKQQAVAASQVSQGEGGKGQRKSASVPASYQGAWRETKKGEAGDSKSKEAAAKDADPKDAAARITVEPASPCDYYEEGPATLAPLPLPAVTAFFDADVKVNGRKAKFFNYADGLATLGSSLIPFFGTGFKDAHVAFTGGLVPGIRRGLGDLSGQQLQNLAALSWQGLEEVAARGGSVEKFVFIQRGDQVFSPGFGERLRKTIKNIEGLEVVGYEVQQSEPKRASPAGQQ